MQTLDKHFDKLLLFALFILCFCGALFIHARGGMDEGSLDWARETTNSILSGLLGVLGGRAWQAHIDKKAIEPPAIPPTEPKGEPHA